MDNKKATATKANAPHARKPLKLCPRQKRVVQALMQAGERWTSRENIDRIAGASNGPAVIQALRRKGIEIAMQKVESTDRDGKLCKSGQYRLTPKGFDVLSEVFTT